MKPLKMYRIEAAFSVPSKRLVGIWLQNPRGGPGLLIMKDKAKYPEHGNSRLILIKPENW